MSDAIERATEVLHKAWIERCGVTAPTRDHVDVFARALDAAGLLATPAHGAAVAARALREAAEDAKATKVHAGGGNLVTDVRALTADALRARADRIEVREP